MSLNRRSNILNHQDNEENNRLLLRNSNSEQQQQQQHVQQQHHVQQMMIPPSPPSVNRSSLRKSLYDVSSTMARLRDTMVGTSSTAHQVDHNILQHHGINDDGRNSVLSARSVPLSKRKIISDVGSKSDETFPAHLHKDYDTFHEDQYSYSLSKAITTQTDEAKTSFGSGDDTNVNKNKNWLHKSLTQKINNVLHQIPSVALIAMFHLMIGIPFGVSYFPIGWKEEGEVYTPSYNSTNTGNDHDSFVRGPFPIKGKNALGIRMFLFSTIIGQLIFTFQSGFKNPIGLQMVENVPFCQALAAITIKHCGYGLEALSTLFVMFGFSSIIVGVVFFTLGKFQLGRVIYFFPSHVLVGLIAGIGVFICKTGVEVTINAVFTFQSLMAHYQLLVIVLIFELLLRLLETFNTMFGKNGKPYFSLLSPIYFCSITPIFYLCLWLLGVSVDDAEKYGYFFPSLNPNPNCDGSDSCTTADSSFVALMSFMKSTVMNEDIFDMWKVIDFKNISWVAIRDSIPTLIAITIFSLIHVPINIPAFAVSTQSEYDMNQELIAHGYSNCIAGCFGGLANYMAYTQSILYDRSGGYGKLSGVAVAIVTGMLYFIGPSIASYIPRAMAGTLLVHVGIDLFLEGVYDTRGKFERLEYAGIWLIALVMTFFGMDAAMIAGKK